MGNELVKASSIILPAIIGRQSALPAIIDMVGSVEGPIPPLAGARRCRAVARGAVTS